MKGAVAREMKGTLEYLGASVDTVVGRLGRAARERALRSADPLVPKVVIYLDPIVGDTWAAQVRVPNGMTINGVEYLISDRPVAIEVGRDDAVTVNVSLFASDVTFKDRQR